MGSVRVFCAIVVLAAAGRAGAGERPAGGLEAGAAKADITPPTGHPMWGYAARRDAPSVGVLDPLYARALVLSAGGTRDALVGLDLGRALSLKRRARLEHVFFLGYCNDYQQYFPTIEAAAEEAAAEGGYGADATVSPAEVGAGERMIDRALIHLYKMRGKMPNLPPKKDGPRSEM